MPAVPPATACSRPTTSPPDPAVPAFTIGFWVRNQDASCSQGVSNGATVLGNKNYDSGNNAGIIVSLWASREMRFNAGSGTSRADSNGYSLSAGQLAYAAKVVDKAGLKMTGYLFDPVKGTQTGSAIADHGHHRPARRSGQRHQPQRRRHRPVLPALERVATRRGWTSTTLRSGTVRSPL